MSNLPTKETKANFNKLSNYLNIKLIKGNRSFIFYMKDYINNEESLNKRPIDLSIKNKQVAFSSNLPFGILSFSSYVDIETMNIIFSDLDMNEYKLLGTKSKQIVNALKLLEIPLF